MSFCNNCKSDKIPGPIKGNSMQGICDRTCIECNKVLDMCMKQEILQNIPITITNLSSSSLVAPYTFLSAKSVVESATISNLVVTDLMDGSCNSRVSCTITVPLQVAFTDANGTQGTASASFNVTRDVILHTSAPSVMPYEIAATAAVVSNTGTYVGDNIFSINCCSTIILKVLMQVHLLVPSYGYCYIPPCTDYSLTGCEGVFDIPLYPQECGVENRCSAQLR